MVAIQYLLKLSVCLGATWLFYQLVLRRLTFYSWNRWYLLVCSLLAFLLPLIDIAPMLEKNALAGNRLVTAIPAIIDHTGATETPAAATSAENRFVDKAIIVQYILAAGILVMLVRLLLQYISLLYIRKSAQLLLDAPVRVYQVDKPVIPFSFGNAIFINQHLHDEQELKEIIRHEFIHVKQRHTIDIILSELVCILAWYNPFAWLLRRSVRQNLEFIADHQVLQSGLDKKQYQYLLLRVIGVNAFSIASNFNFSSLKKRIAMMNKVKSARMHLVRFLLLLPVVVIILVAFRNDRQQKLHPVTPAMISDTVPTPKPKALPENVRSIQNRNDRVTVILKNGKTEQYDLNKPEEKAAFEARYGKMPVAPAPPVPVHGPAASPVKIAAPPVGPAPSSIPAPPVPPAPPVIPALPEGVSGLHIRGNKATVTLKNGKKEEYDLNNPKEKKIFDRKYRIISTSPASNTSPASKAPSQPVPVAATVTAIGPTPSTEITGQAVRAHVYTTSAHYAEPVPVQKAYTTTIIADTIYIQPYSTKEINLENTGTSNEDVIAWITSNTTSAELEKLKKELTKRGITIEWKNKNFNDGRLASIEGMISDGSAACNFHVEDFSKIMFCRAKGKDGKKSIYIRVTNGKVRG